MRHLCALRSFAELSTDDGKIDLIINLQKNDRRNLTNATVDENHISRNEFNASFGETIASMQRYHPIPDAFEKYYFVNGQRG